MITRTPIQAQVRTLEKVFLSNSEAKAYLGVSDTTLKNWRAEGRLRYYKIGALIWYEKADIDRFIRKHKAI